MAIDITNETSTTATRITGPLSASFSMTVDVIEGKESECVEVPGVVLSSTDDEFVAAVYWGRCCYFGETDAFVDQAGYEVKELTLDLLQSGALREKHSCDITSADIVKLVFETVNAWGCSKAWRAGFLVGYINACADVYLGQACQQCGLRRGTCSHS